NQFEIEEDSTYPSSTKIIYKKRFKNRTQRSFIYNIQKEGIYPSNTGHGTKHKIVYCQIDYIDNKPQFLIKYGVNFENTILSTKSTSQAALLYENIYYYIAINSSSKTTISGSLVFGLQLKTVQKVRKSYNKLRQVKPANQYTETTLENRARALSSKSLLIINNQASQIYHPKDKLTLKTLEFSVNEYDFHIKFGSDNKIKTK
ncbi:4805_t:CDS:2, partial [Dentiscutata erythropus]